MFIPYLDFNETWTDQQLYEKFNLTQEEINYINRLVQGNDSAPSSNITDKFSAMIDTVKGTTFTIGEDTTTYSFSDLFSKFTLDRKAWTIKI